MRRTIPRVGQRAQDVIHRLVGRLREPVGHRPPPSWIGILAMFSYMGNGCNIVARRWRDAQSLRPLDTRPAGRVRRRDQGVLGDGGARFDAGHEPSRVADREGGTHRRREERGVVVGRAAVGADSTSVSGVVAASCRRLSQPEVFLATGCPNVCVSRS
jgi:hypothetical protein